MSSDEYASDDDWMQEAMQRSTASAASADNTSPAAAAADAGADARVAEHADLFSSEEEEEQMRAVGKRKRKRLRQEMGARSFSSTDTSSATATASASESDSSPTASSGSATESDRSAGKIDVLKAKRSVLRKQTGLTSKKKKQKMQKVADTPRGRSNESASSRYSLDMSNASVEQRHVQDFERLRVRLAQRAREQAQHKHKHSTAQAPSPAPRQQMRGMASRKKQPGAKVEKRTRNEKKKKKRAHMDRRFHDEAEVEQDEEDDDEEQEDDDEDGDEDFEEAAISTPLERRQRQHQRERKPQVAAAAAAAVAPAVSGSHWGAAVLASHDFGDIDWAEFEDHEQRAYAQQARGGHANPLRGGVYDDEDDDHYYDDGGGGDKSRHVVVQETAPSAEDARILALKDAEPFPQFNRPRHFDPSVTDSIELRSADSTSPALCPRAVINATVARYLLPHQVDGVKFLFRCVSQRQPAILGDDMGLGKTLQTIALLLVLFNKSCTDGDRIRLRSTRQFGARAFHATPSRLHFGPRDPGSTGADLFEHAYAALIVCTASTREQWGEELRRWGHFAVVIVAKADELLDACRLASRGKVEVVVVAYGLVRAETILQELTWKLIVYDEVQTLKTRNSKVSQAAARLRAFVRIGLTGTLFQNDFSEMWAVLSCLRMPGVGKYSVFNKRFSMPIKQGRKRNCTAQQRYRGDAAADALRELLRPMYLRREKKDMLDVIELEDKMTKVLFCALSPIQATLYRRFLDGFPDVRALRCALRLKRLQLHQNANELHTSAGQGVGYGDFVGDVYQAREESVLWRYLHAVYADDALDADNEDHDYDDSGNCNKMNHAGDRNKYDGQDGGTHVPPEAMEPIGYSPCEGPGRFCPHCLCLPVLTKLLKLCNHPALLLPSRRDPDPRKKHADQQLAALTFEDRDLEAVYGAAADASAHAMARHERPEHLLAYQNPALSGKLLVLDSLLRKIHTQNRRLDEHAPRQKVLVFSGSTQFLDILEYTVKVRGYEHFRMDGSTPSQERYELCEQFNDPACPAFVFLLSTGAAGLGLNLTGASTVVQMDTAWNPSKDDQAADRAWRIGQQDKVTVYRLVSRGCLEEMVFLRQIYKRQLGHVTTSARSQVATFEAVQGDQGQKGELFGMENLLSFSPNESFRNKLKLQHKIIAGRAGHSDVLDDGDRATVAKRNARARELLQGNKLAEELTSMEQELVQTKEVDVERQGDLALLLAPGPPPRRQVGGVRSHALATASSTVASASASSSSSPASSTSASAAVSVPPAALPDGQVEVGEGVSNEGNPEQVDVVQAFLASLNDASGAGDDENDSGAATSILGDTAAEKPQNVLNAPAALEADTEAEDSDEHQQDPAPAVKTAVHDAQLVFEADTQSDSDHSSVDDIGDSPK